MKKLFLILVLVTGLEMSAQAPGIDWMHQYGGTLGEYFRTAISTQDGGFLIGGYSNSPISGLKTDPVIGFNNDYWIIKTNAVGTIVWQKTIGGGRTWGLGDEVGEYLSTICLAADGSGYYLSGYSDSGIVGMKSEPSFGGLDYWIVKISLTGELLWQKTMGGSASDYLTTAVATADGGCMVGGYSYSGNSGNKTGTLRGLSDYWVVKFSPSGIPEWQQTIGGSGLDELYAIVPSEDGYLLAGTSSSPISGDKTADTHGYGDYWIVKLSLSGSLLWQRDLGGTGGDSLFRAIKTNNGYILAGESTSSISFDKSENCRGLEDYWLVSTDNAGNVNWDKTYGGSEDEFLYDLKATADSGYIVVGGSKSSNSGDKNSAGYGNEDAWIIKLDGTGNLSWQQDIGGVESEAFNQVISLADGSYLLGGMFSIGSAQTGNITVDNYGTYDYLLVKLQSENLGINFNSRSNLTIFPNPSNEKITINFNSSVQKATLDIYNAIGSKVGGSEFTSTSSETISLPDQAGVYFIKIDIDGHQQVERVIRR